MTLLELMEAQNALRRKRIAHMKAWLDLIRRTA